MRSKRALLLGAPVLAAALFLAPVGCGRSGSPTSDVKVSLKEWTITPDLVAAKAGKVRFVVTNDGTEPHEFVILKTDLALDALPAVEGKVDEDKTNHIDEIETFAANKTETKTVDLKVGRYVFICNIVERPPGQPVLSHYLQGMRVAFPVGQ